MLPRCRCSVSTGFLLYERVFYLYPRATLLLFNVCYIDVAVALARAIYYESIKLLHLNRMLGVTISSKVYPIPVLVDASRKMVPVKKR